MRWVPLTFWLGALLIVALVAARETLLQAAGDFLAVSDPLRRADAVVAISGNNPERVRSASRLLLEGYGQWLIVSGPARQALEMAELARRAGVPHHRILVDQSATSTLQNAQGTAQVMRTAGLRDAILVTSPYHMRRAIILFRQVFRTHGLTVTAYSVPDSFVDLQGWWQRPRDRKFVLREMAKLVGLLVGVR